MSREVARYRIVEKAARWEGRNGFQRNRLEADQGEFDKASMSTVTKVDAVVIGAGVLGIAVARALACPSAASSSLAWGPDSPDLGPTQKPPLRRRPMRRKREVLLLEKNSAIGMETSSRNSQVIHAGLYYPPHSRKAAWCVEGRRRLYGYCRDRSVPVNRCGKLVVATTQEQAVKLHELHGQALRNGVLDVELLTSREHVLDMEPELTTTLAALWSPSTGIVNVHELMQHLLTDAQEEGATTLALNAEIKEARISDEGRIWLRVPPNNRSESSENLSSDDDEMWLDCEVVVNAAGLWADQVARVIHTGGTSGGPCWKPPRQYFCAAGVPGARSGGRTGRPCHSRRGRTGQVRPRRRMDANRCNPRGVELRAGSKSSAVVLRQHPAVLARPSSRFPGSGLLRSPAQAVAPSPARTSGRRPNGVPRLLRGRAERPRRQGSGPPLGDGEPGPDVCPRRG
jgi:FAD dependent oxidoreductase